MLQTAASLIATSGLRTSLQEIANAAGILPGSLYHHFESKEAILVELLRRYHTDLDRIAAQALEQVGRPRHAVRLRPDRRISARRSRSARSTHSAALQMTFYEGHGPNRELTALAQQRPTAILERCSRPAGRQVERLPEVRRRARRARRPARPGDAAGRTRRHPLQRQRRQGRRAAVPNPVGGTGQPCRPPTPSWIAPPAFLAADEVVKSWGDDATPTRRQGRPHPRRRACRVRPQGLRSHHHQGHRVGRGSSAPARCID